MSSVRFPADITQSCGSNLNDDLISAYPLSIMRVFSLSAIAQARFSIFHLESKYRFWWVFFRYCSFSCKCARSGARPEKRNANRLVTLLDVLSLEVACLPCVLDLAHTV